MRVLVATDVSDAADLALREGAALASTPADELAVVHVLPPARLVHAFFPPRGEPHEEVGARTGPVVLVRGG
jgi:nucleotide-binding universal stress UspA family protein